MKTIFTIIAFFILHFGFSQNGELKGRITEGSGTGFPGLTVKLINIEKSILETQTDFDGKYSFKDIPFGNYSIVISSIGMREETVENIKIEIPQKVSDFIYPKPCVGSKKICPKGHRNKIIPITYGLPSKKTIKRAQNKKLKLGGCTLYCEKWHCLEHDLDF